MGCDIWVYSSKFYSLDYISSYFKRYSVKVDGIITGTSRGDYAEEEKSRELRSLQKMGYEVWIYTSSFRTENYIKSLFRCYGVVFDGIVNGTRHLKEVQQGHSETLPQKLPSRYRISLHIDDETIVCTLGRQYGYNVYQLDAEDDNWKEKIIAQAEQIRRRQFP